MKQHLIKITVNALIGVLTSVATLYLGGQAAEAVAASGATAGVFGQRAADAAVAALA